MRASERSQWKVALLKMRPAGSDAGGRKVCRSAARKEAEGTAARALVSMLGEVSTPVRVADGKAERRADVLFPGPQPRS